MSGRRVDVRFELDGQGNEVGVIDAWLVAEGDAVDAGDVLAELAVAKVTLELVAPVKGSVLRIERLEGEEVAVGDRLLVLETVS